MEFKHVQSLQTEKYKTLLRDFKSLDKWYDIPCFRVKFVQNGFSKGKNSKHDKKNLDNVPALRLTVKPQKND